MQHPDEPAGGHAAHAVEIGTLAVCAGARHLPLGRIHPRLGARFLRHGVLMLPSTGEEVLIGEERRFTGGLVR